MQRRLAFSNLLAQLTADRLPEVLALIAQAAPVYDLHAEHEMLWERWGELDGPAACQAIFEKDARFEHTGISQKTIEAWSRQNPQAASAWLMAQQDIPLKASMMRGVLDGYAFCDPAGAHDFIRSELADAALKDHGYWRVARSQLVEKGLTGVQDYFARFDKSDANYKQLTFTVADIFTDAGSREALQWMAGLEAGNREQVSGYMLGRLINDRPDDLVRTLAGSEATGGMNRQEVISQAVAAWTKVNPDDMGLWLRDNRQAPHYDEIAAAYVNHIRSVDPAAAEAWSKTIKNPASSRE